MSTVTYVKTKNDMPPLPGGTPDHYWDVHTFQVDAEKDVVKRFVSWWNTREARAKMPQYFAGKEHGENLRGSYYELQNIGRGKFKVAWCSWQRAGGTHEEIEQIMNAAWADFENVPPPPPPKKRRTPAEVQADEKAIPPLDPLVLETLQADVQPYLDDWGQQVVDRYVSLWQEYETWAEAVPRDEDGTYTNSVTNVKRRPSSGISRPYVRDWVEEVVYGENLSHMRNASHPLLQWQYYTEPLDKMRPRFERMAEDFKTYARIRLLRAVGKYLPPIEGTEVTSVKHTELHDDGGTLIGDWEITYADGTRKQLDTKMIWAGGYNIQRLHTRYLVHVRDLPSMTEAKYYGGKDTQRERVSSMKREGFTMAGTPAKDSIQQVVQEARMIRQQRGLTETAGTGFYFDTEPEGLINQTDPTAAFWWEDYTSLSGTDEEGLEADLSFWGGIKQVVGDSSIPELEPLLKQLDGFEDGAPFSAQVWEQIMQELVTAGWGVYDSDTRTLLWAPGTADFTVYATEE